VEYAAALGLLWLWRVLPRPVAEGFARLVFRLLSAALPRWHRAAARNLEIVFPESTPAERRRMVQGCFASLARLVVSVARFPTMNRHNIHQWIRYEGFEHYEQAKRRGRGILFATGHLGNWELSAFAHALMAEPMSIVVRPLDNPLLEALAERYRSGSGNRILARKDLLRPVVRALAANEAVGILVDQNTTEDRGVFVQFFQRPACVDAGFARLAHRTGATVIPGFAVWSDEEAKFILRFFPPVAITGDELLDTQAVQEALEQAIRANPDQWLWIHRRWKTRPPGELPIY
jgi:KDO2-lipid IV(A) lauroyltransferase